MKSRTWMWTAAVYLFAALTVPVALAAQNKPSPDHRHRHQQYRLIDIGTFGGPASELTTNNGVGAGSLILNNRGTLTGSADTPVPDPFSPNCYAASCFVSHAFQWKDGYLIDLGALPGVNTSQGTAINERGWIAGLLQTGEVDPITGGAATDSVLWRHQEITDLGTLSGYESIATSVNDAGEVVGLSTVDGPIDPYSFLGQSIHTFYWRNGVMQDVGTLGGPDVFPGVAHALQGEVVGASFINAIPNPTTGVPTLHPFIWKHGRMRDLGTLGGTLCCTQNVVANSSGQIASDSTLAGDLQTHPFLWDGRRMIDLGTLGGDNGFAFNISDRGDVVGAADLPGSRHGFLWRNGVMTDLGSLGRTSSAIAINSSGQVTGSSRIDDTPGNNRAFLWENGGPMVDLNALIPENSPLTLVWASNINERGEIAGLGVPSGCQPADYLLCGHAYLLIPHGDCDGDCQQRVADSQAEAELRRQNAPAITKSTESPLRPIKRFRSVMRQRYHIPGQPTMPSE